MMSYLVWVAFWVLVYVLIACVKKGIDLSAISFSVSLCDEADDGCVHCQEMINDFYRIKQRPFYKLWSKK